MACYNRVLYLLVGYYCVMKINLVKGPTFIRTLVWTVKGSNIQTIGWNVKGSCLMCELGLSLRWFVSPHHHFKFITTTHGKFIHFDDLTWHLLDSSEYINLIKLIDLELYQQHRKAWTFVETSSPPVKLRNLKKLSNSENLDCVRDF